MKDALLEALEKFTQGAKSTWVIKYNDKHVSVGKKSGWISLGATKNALRHWLPNFNDWRKRNKNRKKWT